MIKIVQGCLLTLFLMLTVSASAQKTFKNPILPGFHPDPSYVGWERIIIW